MRVLALLLFMFTMAAPAAAEPVPGDSCSGFPAGAVMRSGGPELGGKVYVMTCTANIWAGAEINPDPCKESSVAPGTKCLGGDFFAGTLDGRKLIIAASDGPGQAGREANQSYLWSTASYDIPALENCSRIGSFPNEAPGNEASCSDGASNTAIIADDVSYSYPAASYCAYLVAHGHDDWYLPAAKEMWVVHQNRSALGIQAGTEYWTSSEVFSSNAWFYYHNDNKLYATPTGAGKIWSSGSNRVRCMRLGA